MAQPSTATRAPITRRVVSTGSSSSPPPNAAVSAVRSGTTARSAVSPRVAAGPLSSAAKRASSRSSPTPTAPNGDLAKASRESLEAALKRETEEKESLLLRIQTHEQTIAVTTKENDGLTSALSTAETRLGELYSEQSRMEEELAGKLEIIDKLRIQVKELEKEKRDVLRRYNEQTATFEAERQAFYDSEQHLKSRIQTLSQARRNSVAPRSPSIAPQELPSDDEDAVETPARSAEAVQEGSVADEDTEPAEMTALKLELSTLSTSHSSIQSTLHLLQTQLNDLKRVNNELQEENESYNILLRERTLSGQFNIMRTAGGRGNDEDDDDEEATMGSPTEDNLKIGDREGRPSANRSRSGLDVVPEADEIPNAAAAALARREGSPSSRNSKRSRRGGPRPGSPVTRGETLADLPVAGPGLDLAAELGRAENKDILEGRAPPTPQASVKLEPSEMQALRTEVKALKDANKALSLYASKIIDRIISQEGFEHVLAVDYETPKATKTKVPDVPKPPPKARPTSSFFPSRSNTISLPADSAGGGSSGLARTNSLNAGANAAPIAPAMEASASAPMPEGSAAPNASETAADKRARRGLSMDWKGLTGFFGGGATPAAEAKSDKLRPLTLKAGSTINNQGTTSVPGTARKIETIEDENDRRERERMLATMKLMGIETPAAPSPPIASTGALHSRSMSLSQAPGTPPPVASPPASTRVPFFTRFRSNESASSSQSSLPPPPLTAEALEQSEAESTLAALDAKEKALSADLARGKGVSGFTELSGGRGSLGEGYRKRSSNRSASGGGRGRASIDVGDDAGSVHSRTGSAHTLFSAGMQDE